MNRALKIKVCGMREPDNVRDVATLKPDYMGFIFYPLSKRYCAGLNPEIVKRLPGDIEPVMVTVDMAEDEILDIAVRYGFRTVQLHGSESPEMCRSLRNKGMKVIKAVGISSAESFTGLKDYEEATDLLLFDTSCAEKGGSGRKFDWQVLSAYDLERDFMLSGGIGEEDADTVKALRHPHFRGIDLNSRFEISAGVKDVEKLNRFFGEMK